MCDRPLGNGGRLAGRVTRWSWTIRRWCSARATGTGNPWRPFLDSFSLAAVEMVLAESLIGRAGLHANLSVDDNAQIARLEAVCERLPFPDYPAWWQPEVPQAVRWFARPGVLIREDSRTPQGTLAPPTRDGAAALPLRSRAAGL